LFFAVRTSAFVFALDVDSLQIFPIWESPIQRLRVKLIGLKKAAHGGNFSVDIQQLGRTMLWMATVLPEHSAASSPPSDASALCTLKAYDPSLHFLLTWMLSDSPPDALEVLRHPYFMTSAERQTFGIALGGGKTCGMIGSYLCDNPHNPLATDTTDALWSAVKDELTQHLDGQLGVMFHATDKAKAPKSGGSTGGGAGGAGGAGGGGASAAAAAAAASAAAVVNPASAFWTAGLKKVTGGGTPATPAPQRPSALPPAAPVASVKK